ncbi:hypothetical protein BTA51_02185 [Hahella sp. CCB-MM4]|nr:hypothetical protein BTA51_02185 [Hahella sp. CCB-MM4]
MSEVLVLGMEAWLYDILGLTIMVKVLHIGPVFTSMAQLPVQRETSYILIIPVIPNQKMSHLLSAVERTLSMSLMV